MKNSRFLVSLFALAIFSLACQSASAWAAPGNPNAVLMDRPNPNYEVIIEADVMVPMRDGQYLCVNVARPDAPGSFPAIIYGTPYGKDAGGIKGQDYAKDGYVYITLDMRGFHKSSAAGWQLHDGMGMRADSYDLIEWISNQDWSNGRVGAVGGSAGGLWALFTASCAHPNLQAVVAQRTASDLWRNWYFRGGAMELGFSTFWGAMGMGEAQARIQASPDELQNYLDNMAIFYADREGTAEVLPIYKMEQAWINDEITTVEAFLHLTDDPYWWYRSPISYFHEVSVPIMHTIGLYDCFLDGGLRAFQQIQIDGKTELARDNQYLLLSPFAHSGDGGPTQSGLLEFGQAVLSDEERYGSSNDSAYMYGSPSDAFFDYWLRDIAHTWMVEVFTPETPVRFFTPGLNEWRSAPSWPRPEIVYTNYYLNSGPSGSIASLNDGKLSTAAQSEPAALTYAYDPMDPIPTRGGSGLGGFSYGPDGLFGSTDLGGQEQTPVDLRSLTFTTDVLSEAVEVSGPIRAILYASSDCLDTDFVVRLTDVRPDGSRIGLAEGIQRARFRDSDFSPSLLTPGEVYKIEVDLWSFNYLFEPGHRIGVTVNSSSYPRWSRNMNVAEFPEYATEWKVANNTIYLDPERPSHVILPVIPR